MKYVLFTLLAITLLVFTGCGGETDVPVNDTEDQATETTNETIEEPDVEELAEEPEEVVPPVDETKLDLPEEIEILLTDIDVFKNTYGESEQHELNMILSTTQYEKIVSGSISFTPLCNEAFKLFVSINDKLLYSGVPVCDEHIIVPLTKADLEKGPNVIEFKNDIQESYELIDIAVVFTYDDGTEETLPADDHYFLSEESAPKSVKDIGIVSMTNQVVRTFSLTEQELHHDLHLQFEALEREGDILILLNSHLIYEGSLRKDHKLALPEEHLLVGKNVLTFIGMEE